MKILIAEDQEPSALFLQRMLERMGHEVTVARDGREAWNLTSETRFPLIISDWVMPDLNGLELCRRIREQQEDSYTYIILITNKHSQQDRLVGLRAGADDFLVKPPDAEELAVRLEIAWRILAVYDELERRNNMLAELAHSDELTGVKNRRRFREALEIYFSMARRQGLQLSMVMLDVDNFKDFNDRFGHPAGDEVLKEVGQALRDNIRKHDEVARVGGEEFAILLPDTDANLARDMAERIRATIEGNPWPLRPITASLGVATSEPETPSPAHLVEQADQALYHSKRSGRNRVSHFREVGDALSTS